MDSRKKWALFDKAKTFADSEKYDDAIDLLDRLLMDDFPEPMVIFSRRGYAKYKSGQYASAVEDFDEFVAIRPKAPNVLFVRALCKEYLEDFDGAIKDYEDVISIAPETDDAYSGLAYIYEYRDDLVKAKALYEKALELNPENPRSLRRLPVLGQWHSGPSEE